jgi:hypothetical protein
LNSPDRLRILVSFAEGEDEVEKYIRPDWQVLLDSGAFTNFTSQRDVVTLDHYTGYLRERGPAFWRYFCLDRIADHEASARNFGLMLAAGLQPVPVFQRGANVRYMAELKQHSDLIAIGGVARRLKSFEDREYLHQAVRAADGHNVHILGCGDEEILRMYRPYSSDSASHAMRFGKLLLWHGGKFHGLSPDKTTRELLFDNRPVAQNRRLFAQVCGSYDIDQAQTMKREFYGANAAKVANLRSFMRYQKMLKRLGVEYFIACVSRDRLNAVEAWERENANVHAAA